MNVACLLLLSTRTCAAFNLRAPASRRAVVAAAPALLVPLATRALDDNKAANCLAAGGSSVDCGLTSSAVAQLMATPGQGDAAGIRLGGTYTDASQPGCTRRILLAGKNAIVSGTDEPGGKPWKVNATPVGKYLVVDFSSRGGSEQTIAKWNGLGLVFQDGTVWTKK
jgi:imidazolonepropionase-like amidohydrolase|eukprot:2355668-Prymnesium_polylepis.1